MSEEKIGYIDAGGEKDTACVIVSDGTVTVKMTNLSSLVSWLLQNEGEIAYDLRGYGVLTGTFEDLIKRKPLKGNLGGTYR